MDSKATVYIMGYSLDAVIEALRRNMNGEKVHFLAKAHLTSHSRTAGSE